MGIDSGLVDTAARELCRLLDLDPMGISNEPGYKHHYNLHWARREIERAVAIQAAIKFATGTL